MPNPKKPKPPEPKTDYESKLSPIPPEHFDDDMPFRSDTDTSEGSLYDRGRKLIEEAKGKRKA